MNGSPTDGRGFGKRVQSVRQPNVNVDCETASTNRAKGFLAYWNGMFLERSPKAGIQAHAVLPEGWLGVVDDARKGNGVLNKSTIVAQLCSVFAIGEEREAARGNAARLLCH